MNDKVEAFVECLLSDLFGCFVDAVGVDLQLPNRTEEDDEKRCVPDNFYSELIVFSRVFVDELMPEMEQMPVLLCWSEDFFKRFTNSVCLKLINNDDPEVGFLKVMSFLIVITAMSFVKSCYRAIDEIPIILRDLLKHHIKTKFYEEDRFDAISLQCQQLKEEEENWCESTVEEMRTCINDSLKTELPKTEPTCSSSFQERTKIKIKDVRLHENILRSSVSNCPYCDVPCFLLLKAFYKPRIMYKPECKQM